MSRSKREVKSSSKPPTMRDVAAVAGVHQTTVSLALRNHPSVAAKTREKIKAAAERLGYRPDPLLDAFNEHRLAVNPTHSSSVIAYIVEDRIAGESQPGNYVEMRWSGVTQAAGERGLKVERFSVGPSSLSPERLNQILVTRGIVGVIIGGVLSVFENLTMDWAQFSVVRIESRQIELGVDTVSADQRHAVRLSVRNLRRLGYRRIGLATSIEDETRLGEPMTSGFLVEEAALAEEDRVPPFLFPADSGPRKNKEFLNWIKKHQIEAIVSNWGNIPQALTDAGIDFPGEIAFASLDIPAVDSDISGVMQNHELVGRTAVEHLAILLHTHQRGVMAAPATTYVPGYWRDGTTAPAKAGSSAPSGAEATFTGRL